MLQSLQSDLPERDKSSCSCTFPCTGDSYWLVPAFGHVGLCVSSARVFALNMLRHTWLPQFPAQLTAWGEIEVPASQVLAFNEALSKVPFWRSVRLWVRASPHYVFLHQKCMWRCETLRRPGKARQAPLRTASMPWAKPKTCFPLTKRSSQMYGL